ncbi:MAG: universal stress protein [Bacteroidetes bacterium]|nr:MAG: universal stress protein [Bacteroidota bacterium]
MTELESAKEKRFPVTFKRVALAIALSPRAEALLFEAVRIAKMFEAQLTLIHVGELSDAQRVEFDELITRAGGQELAPEIVAQSGKPVDVILNVCKEKNTDLLIAGALQKENLVRYFRGSIARKLSREANCSILLITNPKKESEICSRILVNGLSHPKTPDTVKTAVYVAGKFNANELMIADEVPTKAIRVRVNDDKGLINAERKRRVLARAEHRRLNKAIREVDVPNNTELTKHVLYGRPGYSIGHFAADKGVDLLVMNSPDTRLGLFDRLFTHDIEYVLSDLPCDLLIVHTTRETAKKAVS